MLHSILVFFLVTQIDTNRLKNIEATESSSGSGGIPVVPIAIALVLANVVIWGSLVDKMSVALKMGHGIRLIKIDGMINMDELTKRC